MQEGGELQAQELSDGHGRVQGEDRIPGCISSIGERAKE